MWNSHTERRRWLCSVPMTVEHWVTLLRQEAFVYAVSPRRLIRCERDHIELYILTLSNAGLQLM